MIETLYDCFCAFGWPNEFVGGLCDVTHRNAQHTSFNLWLVFYPLATSYVCLLMNRTNRQKKKFHLNIAPNCDIETRKTANNNSFFCFFSSIAPIFNRWLLLNFLSISGDAPCRFQMIPRWGDFVQSYFFFSISCSFVCLSFAYWIFIFEYS